MSGWEGLSLAKWNGPYSPPWRRPGPRARRGRKTVRSWPARMCTILRQRRPLGFPSPWSAAFAVALLSSFPNWPFLSLSLSHAQRLLKKPRMRTESFISANELLPPRLTKKDLFQKRLDTSSIDPLWGRERRDSIQGLPPKKGRLLSFWQRFEAAGLRTGRRGIGRQSGGRTDKKATEADVVVIEADTWPRPALCNKAAWQRTTEGRMSGGIQVSMPEKDNALRDGAHMIWNVLHSYKARKFIGTIKSLQQVGYGSVSHYIGQGIEMRVRSC